MKKEILTALSAAAVLMLTGCGNGEGQKTRMEVSAEAPKTHTEPAAEAAPAPVKAVAEQARQEAHKAVETIEKNVQKAVDDAKQEASKAVESAKEAAPKADGAALFTKCAGCHGAKGEKHALGKSNIIAGQSKADLVKKIKGYQDGSYGGAMKGLMVSQVKGLNDAQIEALADYISKL